MSGGGDNTTTTQKEIPEWAQGYAKDFLDNVGTLSGREYEPFAGQRIADTSADTTAAYNAVRSMSGVGQPEMQDIIGVGRQVAAYQPAMVSSPVIGGIQNVNNMGMAANVTAAGPAANVAAKMIDNLPQVTAQQLAGKDLNPYMNPFTQDVTNRAVGDVMRSNDVMNSQARTGAAGAYASGSARAALLEAENNRNAMDRAGNVSAGLNLQNFQNAQNMAVGDINRTMQGDLANQQMAWNRANANASNDLQGQLANQNSYNAWANRDLQGQMSNQSSYNTGAARDLQAQLANQQMGWNTASQNASMNLNSQLANQAAIAQGQGIRLAGTNAMSGAINQARQFGQQDLTNLMTIGGAQEQRDQSALDLAYKDYLRQYGFPEDQTSYGIDALSKLINGQGTTTSTGPGQDNTGMYVGAGASILSAAIMM